MVLSVAPQWFPVPSNIGTIVENSPFTYTFQASGTAPIQYFLISGTVPPGLVMNSVAGQLSGTVPYILSEETFNFTVRAMNTVGFADKRFSLTVTKIPTSWAIGPNLGTVLQNSFYSVMITATDPVMTDITYEVSDGELPPGLTLGPNGLLSGYISTIVFFGTSISYSFTITAFGSSTVSQTFTLGVTSVGNVTPQWNTIGSYLLSLQQGIIGGDVGNILNNIPYSFQLKSVMPNPSVAPITYSLSYGTLPTGITLSATGLLSGTLLSDNVAVFPFTVLITDGTNTATRAFYIRTNYKAEDFIYWLIQKPQIPFDLSTFDPNTTNQITYDGNTYIVTKSSITTNYSQVILNKITNNYNLSLTDTLFVLKSTTGIYNVNSYIGNTEYDSYEIDVIVPSSGEFVFDLGSIGIGSYCSFKVSAVTEQFWIRYRIISGSLPLGLYLEQTTGEIQGQVLPQSVGDFVFEVEAYNYNTTETLSFNITVIAASLLGTNKLTVRLNGYDKLKWLSLSNIDEVPITGVYRMSDENFGKKTSPYITIVSDVTNSNPDDIFTLLQPEITTKITPSTFLSLPVVNDMGDVISEAVVLKFSDAFSGTTLSYDVPVEKNPLPNPTKTNKPGSLASLRTLMINAGYATETFENWMNFYFTTELSESLFVITGSLPGLLSGDPIMFSNQILPGPFENAVKYYAIPITSSSFKLASSYNNAIAGINITFNINESVVRSGTFQYYFPGTPIAYMNIGDASAVASSFNEKINNTPFGYYNLSTSNNIIDTFFTTSYGHNLTTGQQIIFTEDFVPRPFIYGRVYFVIYIDATTFKLAETYLDSQSGTAITITNNINDQTSLPYTGAFKRVLDSGRIQESEADLRFPMTVDMLNLDNRYKYSTFTGSASTDLITLVNHCLETTSSIEFKNQTLTPELSNNVTYYAIVISDDTFKLATSISNANNNIAIDFSVDFTGLLEVDNTKMIPMNAINAFSCIGSSSDSVIVSTQTSKLELGDIITLTSTALPPELTIATNYYIIPISERSYRIASSLINAQNDVFISFSYDFVGNIFLNNNDTEYNLRQEQ